MKHEIIEDLNWRYTTKKYNPLKKVPDKLLDVLFESMRMTPSSINSQPWKFIIIESEVAKQRMARTFKDKFQFNQPHIFDSTLTILFAHQPSYSRELYSDVLDKSIADGRLSLDAKESASGAFVFAELNTDKNGQTSAWTKSQTYLALGNTMHTLARLRIDSTPMEGIDIGLVNDEFATELDGYQCHVALAIGYRHETEDYNAKLPKSRLALERIINRI